MPLPRAALRRPPAGLLLAALLLLAAEARAQEAQSGEAPPAADAGPAPSVVPPGLLADAPAPYPKALVAEGVAGEVLLELLVDVEGEVEAARVLRGAHPLLDAAALHAAPALRFSPARVDGVPSAVRLHFSYRFEAPPPPPPVVVGTLSGLVRAKGSRTPLPGAVVRTDAKPDAQSEGRPGDAEAGVAHTDAEGRFLLTLPPGRHALTLSAPGHLPLRTTEEVREGVAVDVVYALEPLVSNPYETVVRAGRERTEVSRIQLEEAEVREVPGTMGDPFRVVMLLPGVSSVMSGLSYPIVRGSQPAATGYFIDGVRVPLLFHLLLGPAVVHPDFLEGVDFLPGTAPAQYGRLMGGVVEGRVSRPREKGLRATGYADLLNAGLFAEVPFEQTGTSLTLSGRVSYTALIAARVASGMLGQSGSDVVLDFYDYQGRVEQKLGAGRLRLLAFGSSDTVGTRATEVFGTTGLQSILFHRVDGRWRGPLGGGELEVGVTWGVDSLSLESRLAGTGTRTDVDNFSGLARASWQRTLGPGLSLRLGGELERKSAGMALTTSGVDPDSGTPLSLRREQPVANAFFSGLWGQLVWEAGGWTVLPGLRVDSYHLFGDTTRPALEPRLSVRKTLSEALTLKGGVGLFHQAPTLLINLPVVDIAGLRLGLQESWQVDVGAEWKLWRGLELNADVYLNRLSRTVEVDPFSDGVDGLEGLGGLLGRGPLPQLGTGAGDVAGDGWAYGLEVMLRHPLGQDWFGWLSYTLQRSVRNATFARYDAAGLRSGTATALVPFVYDQTHVANLVLSRKLPGNWTVGGVLHFNSGRPEFGTFSFSRQTNRLVDNHWVPVSRDAVDRLPPFFRVDARVSKTWVHDTFTLEAYLDMLNLTLSREVTGYTYGYELSARGDTQCLPGAGIDSDVQVDLTPCKQPFSLPIALPMLGLKGRY